MFKRFISQHSNHLIAIGIAILVSAFYFYPQMQGLVLEQGDVTQFNGMASETKAYYAKYGKPALWTNSMFSGMPTYQIGGIQHTNVYRYIEKASTLGLSRPIGYFVFGTLSAYVMFLILGMGSWLSIAAGVLYAFSTSNLILFDVGHNTKLFTILGAPLVFGGLYLILRRHKMLKGTLLLSLAIGFNVYKNHYQMTYYLAIFFGIWFLIEAINLIRSKEFGILKRACLAILVSCFLGAGPAATKLLTTYEYAQESIRGESVLSKSNVWTSQDSSIVSQWDFTMQFSQGLTDVKAMFVPGAAGGSSAEKMRAGSPIAREFDRNGFEWENRRANLYWGSMPFSGGPAYLGIVMLLLAGLGFATSKGRMRWWILGSLILATALSMGKQLEWFNRIIFDYFPFYKAFRSPNSVLQIAIIFCPLLAIPFIHKLYTGKLTMKEIRLPLMIVGGVMTGLVLWVYLSSPDQSEIVRNADLSLARSGMDADVLVTERLDYMRSDALRSLLFIGLIIGLIWSYFRFKLEPKLFLGLFFLITLVDFWGINRRYIFPAMFEQPRALETRVAPRQVDLQIMADPDPHYRVYDQTVNSFNNSSASYYHKTIGGYHAAKLRRYEDLIEMHIKPANQKVLNMLNAKYWIQRNDQGERVVVGNREILGNVWYVDNIRWVKTADEEINALNYFNPELDAVIHEEFRPYLEGLNPAREGSIELVSYEPNHLIYESTGNGERLAVFSEIWYSNGWKVYIDGEHHDHIRANYVLRALRVPAGDHRIEFVFDPDIHKVGQWTSSLFSLGFLGLLGYIGFTEWKKGDLRGPTRKKYPKKAASKTTSVVKSRRKKKSKGKK